MVYIELSIVFNPSLGHICPSGYPKTIQYLLETYRPVDVYSFIGIISSSGDRQIPVSAGYSFFFI